jgi:thiol:disulfide interchange protein DsbC
MKIARAVLRTALALAALSCITPLHADEQAVQTRLKQTLQERFPTLRIDSVQPAPFPGVYEVIAGEQVAYADASGNYLIVGRLMDTRTKQDLSAADLDAHNSIDFHTLPLDQAIRIVKGNGRRELAVFADPDCPYCQQLEKDLRSVTDLTVYVFLLPIVTLHPDAAKHAHAIWCAADPSAAWIAWVLDRKAPTPAGKCAGDPTEATATLAASLHVHATPTLFLQSGERIGGDVPLDQLQRLIAQASLPVPGGHGGEPSKGVAGEAPATASPAAGTPTAGTARAAERSP